MILGKICNLSRNLGERFRYKVCEKYFGMISDSSENFEKCFFLVYDQPLTDRLSSYRTRIYKLLVYTHSSC